jgi:hypothetical protein
VAIAGLISGVLGRTWQIIKVAEALVAIIVPRIIVFILKIFS